MGSYHSTQNIPEPKLPIRWLTYKGRLRSDLEALYAVDKGERVFTTEYAKNLSDQAAKADERILKLWTVNTAISAFLLVAFVSADASLSLFGVSLKNVAGVREILLAVAALIVTLVAILSTSRDIMIYTVEIIFELRAGSQFKPFSDLSAPSSLGVKAYVPRQFDRWIFPTMFTKSINLAIGFLLMALLLTAWLVSIVLYLAIAIQVYREPAFGKWSVALLYYLGASWAFALLWMAKFLSPLPYRDKGVFQELAKLQHTDPAAYQILLRKTYGF